MNQIENKEKREKTKEYSFCAFFIFINDVYFEKN